MTTDFRALCAELVQAWDNTLDYEDFGRAASYLVDRARAAQAQEQQGPTDESILAQAAAVISPYDSCGIALGEYEAETECAVEAYGSELIAFARAVLAHWGGAAPQSVAVTERLPKPEDCDEQGQCWWFNALEAEQQP